MVKQAPQRVGVRNSEEIIDLPNLIEVQIKSYNQFLQADKLPHERENIGLEEVFQEIFPIKSYDEKIVLEYISYHIGVPKYNAEECIRRGITYAGTLKARFRLTDMTGIKEEDVYLGTIPLMTQNGTFVINGAERVIVSQLHRSPGICFEQETSVKGTPLYSLRIIPYRGSWLEASFDTSDLIYIYVDKKKRRKKMLATSFIRTLGYSTDADIIEEFFTTYKVKIKSEKDFSRVVGRILAEDVVGDQADVIYGKAGEKLTTAMLKRMVDQGIQMVKIAEEAEDNHPIIKMLAKDTTDSYESALKDFYRRMRPGDPPTLANARSLMIRLFFDPKRYNLGRVGRYKLNRKLGFKTDNTTLDQVTLRKEDAVAAIKYLIGLRLGDDAAQVDDIDHLGNRRVRSVGELVQNQYRLGMVRAEKIIRERMNLIDYNSDTSTPSKLFAAKALVGVLKDFFGRSQLSQFMDQTNPMAEVTHKRRLSALGPGGLSRDRAGFEVRDVHPSHYGRICPIETPEGPNIGLIVSLASYGKVNEFGFIETPYRVVEDGIVTQKIEYLTADQEGDAIIAQASTPLDESGMFMEETCLAREKGEATIVETSKVKYVDVSPKQLVSVVTALIPFLEHDDANRALMGSNMQRQAVPLLIPEAPIVGTGIEKRVARDSGALVIAEEDGIIEYVDGKKIIVASKRNQLEKRAYGLKKFQRSNSGTCLTQVPIVDVGDEVKAGVVLADGPSTDKGELALGRNILVAFMPWCGYNFEDAIIVSQKLIQRDCFTSIHISEHSISARQSKLGDEQITRDVPNISQEAQVLLDEEGIIRVGSKVVPGMILVGRTSPKLAAESSPEDKLLLAIFGEKASDVKDTSLRAAPGAKGIVTQVSVFSKRDRLSKTDDEIVEERGHLHQLQREYREKELELTLDYQEKLNAFVGQSVVDDLIIRKTAEALIRAGQQITQDTLDLLEGHQVYELIFPENDIYDSLKQIMMEHSQKLEKLALDFKTSIEFIKKGDSELDTGVIREVKVHIADKRQLKVGDKMAGRHGNKGVVSKIVPEADMPYLTNGQTVEMILNPLGVPSRMNIGQILETNLGLAGRCAGLYFKVPVFEGFPEEKIWELLAQSKLTNDGKVYLYDGRTGERFDNRVVVGYIYMMKLSHLVDDKIHARSIGPYSLVTQQPLGGKAQHGGQRLGEMEVWSFEAYGASYALLEMLTVKSDDVIGRKEIYQSIVNGKNTLRAGTPSSFKVIRSEIQSLGIDMEIKTGA